MSSRSFITLPIFCLLFQACRNEPKTPPLNLSGELEHSFSDALYAEAKGKDAEAFRSYVRVLDLSLAQDSAKNELAIQTTLASLDALLSPQIPALEGLGQHTALAMRESSNAVFATETDKRPDTNVKPGLSAPTSASEALLDKLLYPELSVQKNMFAKPLMAFGAIRLALIHNRVQEAKDAREQSGCVQYANISPPYTWSQVKDTTKLSPRVEAGDKRGQGDPKILSPQSTWSGEMRSELSFGDASGKEEKKEEDELTQKNRAISFSVAAENCSLPLAAASRDPGMRAVIVDVKLRRDKVLGLAFQSQNSGYIELNGREVLSRPAYLGNLNTWNFAQITGEEGWSRLVVHQYLLNPNEELSLLLFDSKGERLETRAPQKGEKAERNTFSSVISSNQLDLPPTWPKQQSYRAKSDQQKWLESSFLLAAGDVFAAEQALPPLPNEKKRSKEANSKNAIAPPAPADETLAMTAFLKAKILGQSRDIPITEKTDEVRSLLETVLRTWNNSPFALIEHANLSGAKKAKTEARYAALSDLNEQEERYSSTFSGVVHAYKTLLASQEKMFDLSSLSYQKTFQEKELHHSLFLRDAFSVSQRMGPLEAKNLECEKNEIRDYSTLFCRNWLYHFGDKKGADEELLRVRTLYDSPKSFAILRAKWLASEGRLDEARAELKQIPLALVPLDLLAAVEGKSRTELIALATVTHSGLSTLHALLSQQGPHPLLTKIEKRSEQLFWEDLKNPHFPNAGTVILAHDESYQPYQNGLLHWTIYDLRRIQGTTDIDERAEAELPKIEGGPSSFRILRKRILKTDGRILEPEHTPSAAQEHAELSQLEVGDAVEVVYEGWSDVDETWNIMIATPDLQPERTAVVSASMEFKAGFLGKRERERFFFHRSPSLPCTHLVSGDFVCSLDGVAVRHIEPGAPARDLPISAVFGTLKWDSVFRKNKENLEILKAPDQSAIDWTRNVLNTAGTPSAGSSPKNLGDLGNIEAAVSKLIDASGRTLKQSSPTDLLTVSPSSNIRVRTFLTRHVGSRTWLLAKALQDASIPFEIVFAETAPYSSSPNYPASYERFVHPLIYVQNANKWIDADVLGPPLPLGRISPELIGRQAMWMNSGEIKTLEIKRDGESTNHGDKVDLDLYLEPNGDAQGNIEIAIRSRNAQSLSLVLENTVGDVRQQLLRSLVMAWIPSATVNQVELTSKEESWEIQLKAQISIHAFAERVAKTKNLRLPGMDPVHFVFPRVYVTSMKTLYAGLKNRTSDLTLQSPFEYTFSRKLHLPAGLGPTLDLYEDAGNKTSASESIQAQFVESKRQFFHNVSNNTVEEVFSLQVRAGTVNKNQYGEFAQKIGEVDALFKRTQKLKWMPKAL